MKFSFSAKIYKVGINPCVKVPLRITRRMKSSRGYIPVQGKIKSPSFEQTLVPIKNEGYRLYVNGPMLKGSKTGVGDTVKFKIEQDLNPGTAATLPFPKLLKIELQKNNLFEQFKKLIPSRQKEILKYLNYLKTEEALSRNVEKIVCQLKAENERQL